MSFFVVDLLVLAVLAGAALDLSELMELMDLSEPMDLPEFMVEPLMVEPLWAELLLLALFWLAVPPDDIVVLLWEVVPVLPDDIG
jgi:hypothetical protein